MRQLVVSEFMTLDGRMEAPGGEPTHPHTGWVMDFDEPELFEFKFRETLEAESLLLGRITYESFREGWTQREGEFADRMNSMPKHVFSRTLRGDLGWNATVLEGEAHDAIRRLKETDGGPILVAGSCSLVHQLLAAGLVDELRLQVFPVTIGSGLAVFPESPAKSRYALVEFVRYPGGVTLQVYRPA